MCLSTFLNSKKDVESPLDRDKSIPSVVATLPTGWSIRPYLRGGLATGFFFATDFQDFFDIFLEIKINPNNENLNSRTDILQFWGVEIRRLGKKTETETRSRCHPACSHEGSSHLDAVLTLGLFIAAQGRGSCKSSGNGYILPTRVLSLSATEAIIKIPLWQEPNSWRPL